MLKRILAIVLCIMLITQLCACAMTKEVVTDPTTNAPTQNNTENKDNEAAGADDPIFNGAIVGDETDDDENQNAQVDETEKSEYTTVGNCKIYMHDEANLMTEEEIKTMLRDLEDVCNNIEYNILFLTYDNANGASTRQYTNEYMNMLFKTEENNVGFIIDMDNREIYINTMGDAIDRMPESVLEHALDLGFEQVSNDQYKDCLFAMANYCLKKLD